MEASWPTNHPLGLHNHNLPFAGRTSCLLAKERSPSQLCFKSWSPVCGAAPFLAPAWVKLPLPSLGDCNPSQKKWLSRTSKKRSQTTEMTTYLLRTDYLTFSTGLPWDTSPLEPPVTGVSAKAATSLCALAARSRRWRRRLRE